MSTWDDNSKATDGDEYSVEDDDQLTQEDTLIDRGVDDALDEGFSPPERPYGSFVGTTPRERHDGESLDELLAEEEPDPAMEIGDDESERETEFPRDAEVGDIRAGRLIATDSDGLSDNEEDLLLAEDVGIDGAAASAEEAAVHIIEDDE